LLIITSTSLCLMLARMFSVIVSGSDVRPFIFLFIVLECGSFLTGTYLLWDLELRREK
jgi:hypothetical protein